jgi:RNA polymerase sigma factor (sigma-70 family)
MITLESQERFQSLLEAHKKLIFKICNSYCKDRDSRNDLAQEIIVQLWRSFDRFDGRCRFSTWMYRIGLNVAISFYRSESARTRRVISGDDQLLQVTDEFESNSDEVRLLYDFIGGLDPLNKALILLYLDGNSYQEIAEVAGITETNVATRLNRLKNKMKQELNVAGETPARSRT